MVTTFNGYKQNIALYRNFRFRLKWDDRCVAGFSEVDVLKPITHPSEYREWEHNSYTHQLPGPTQYETVTMKRGVSHDPEFEQWVNTAWDATAHGDLADMLRRDIELELYNAAGELDSAYKIRNCRVSAFKGLPELNANGSTLAIQTLKLENEGWERLDEEAENGQNSDRP